jgi:hypothetical protein
MSTSDLNHKPACHQMSVFAPHHAPSCRCADREVMASRDQDGDWVCCRCGRPLTPSLTGLRSSRSAVRTLELRAA